MAEQQTKPVDAAELYTLMERFRARLKSDGWYKIRVDEWHAPAPSRRSIRFNFAHNEQRMHLLFGRYPHAQITLNLDLLQESGLPSVQDLVDRIEAAFDAPADPSADITRLKLGAPCPAIGCNRNIQSLTADSATPSDKLLIQPCGHLYDLITKEVGK